MPYIQKVHRQPSVLTEYPIKVKLARGVLTQDCGVAWPGSGVHAALSGAHRGYSENTASEIVAVGDFHNGERSVPSTSGGAASPASAASVG